MQCYTVIINKVPQVGGVFMWEELGEVGLLPHLPPRGQEVRLRKDWKSVTCSSCHSLTTSCIRTEGSVFSMVEGGHSWRDRQSATMFNLPGK